MTDKDVPIELVEAYRMVLYTPTVDDDGLPEMSRACHGFTRAAEQAHRLIYIPFGISLLVEQLRDFVQDVPAQMIDEVLNSVSLSVEEETGVALVFTKGFLNDGSDNGRTDGCSGDSQADSDE